MAGGYTARRAGAPALAQQFTQVRRSIDALRGGGNPTSPTTPVEIPPTYPGVNPVVVKGAGSPVVTVPGLKGNGLDDAPTIQAVLDSLAAGYGHSRTVWVESPLGSPVTIGGTVQIEKSDITLIFASPVSMLAQGRLRIQGEFTALPDTGIPTLKVAAAAGDTVITVSDAQYFAPGTRIIIRGARGSTGDPVDGQKEIAVVAAVGTPDIVTGDTPVTLTEGLDNTYATFNANPVTPAGWSHFTTIQAVVGSQVVADAAIGDTTVQVASTAFYQVGDWILVGDETNTHTPEGTAEPKNFPCKELVQVAGKPDGSTLQLSRPLWHPIAVANNAYASRVSAVQNSHIKTGQVSWAQDSRVGVAIEQRMTVGCTVSGARLMGAAGKSWWKQGIRMTECWGCSVDDVALLNPDRTGSGEGYGVTLYGATECFVTRTRHERNRHDVLLFNGSSGNLVSHGVSEDARISGPDIHGAQCNSNQFHHWTITGGPSIATNGDGGPGNKYALRIGNTTHADGDYNSLFSDIQVRNWPGAAIEVLPQSKGSIFDGIDVRDTDVGVRLRKLARDIPGALVNTEITVKNSSFADVPTLFDVNGGTTAVVHGFTFKNNDIVRATAAATIKNVQGLRWHDNLWIDPALSGAHALDLATGVTGYRVTGSDLTLTSTGLYDLSAGDDLPGGGGGGGVTVVAYAPDTPAQHGWLEWVFDPITQGSSAGQAMTSGTVYRVKVTARTGGSCGNLVLQVGTTAPGTLTAGQNYAALYDATGTQIAVTGDLSGVWNTSGTKTIPWGAAVTLSVGSDYYVELLSVASAGTGAVLVRATGGQTSGPNAGQSNAAQRFATDGTGQTTLSGAVTLSSGSGVGAQPYWCALKS